MSDTPAHNVNRPNCPNCGRELILTIITCGRITFNTFVCDCYNQPIGFKADIVNAREWDHQAIMLELVPSNE